MDELWSHVSGLQVRVLLFSKVQPIYVYANERRQVLTIVLGLTQFIKISLLSFFLFFFPDKQD